MELALHKYGNYEKFEQATGGNLLTKSRIWSHVKKYMEKEGCVGEVQTIFTITFTFSLRPFRISAECLKSYQ